MKQKSTKENKFKSINKRKSVQTYVNAYSYRLRCDDNAGSINIINSRYLFIFTEVHAIL